MATRKKAAKRLDVAKAERFEHADGSWVEAKTKNEGAGNEATSKPTSRDTNVRMVVCAPGLEPWLKVTSKNTGRLVFVPLPIRLIQEFPEAEGGGCLVRGAHGDEATARESAGELLDVLGGYPIQGHSSWALAT